MSDRLDLEKLKENIGRWSHRDVLGTARELITKVESLTKDLKLQEQDNTRIIQSSKAAVESLTKERDELKAELLIVAENSLVENEAIVTHLVSDGISEKIKKLEAENASLTKERNELKRMVANRNELSTELLEKLEAEKEVWRKMYIQAEMDFKKLEAEIATSEKIIKQYRQKLAASEEARKQAEGAKTLTVETAGEYKLKGKVINVKKDNI